MDWSLDQLNKKVELHNIQSTGLFFSIIQGLNQMTDDKDTKVASTKQGYITLQTQIHQLAVNWDLKYRKREPY